MTRKQYEQQQTNNSCECAIQLFNSMAYTHETHHFERLGYCNAYVCVRGEWVALKSYDTIVALFNPATGILYDVLRLVYGYTATSAQHIAKFRSLMRDRYGYEYGGLCTFTWREV